MGIWTKLILDSLIHPHADAPLKELFGYGGHGKKNNAHLYPAHGGYDTFDFPQQRGTPGRVKPVMGPYHHLQIVSYTEGGEPIGPYELLRHQRLRSGLPVPRSMKTPPRPDGETGFRERWEERQAHNPDVQALMAELQSSHGGGGGHPGGGGGGTQLPHHGNESAFGWAAGSHGPGHGGRHGHGNISMRGGSARGRRGREGRGTHGGHRGRDGGHGGGHFGRDRVHGG